MDYAIIKLGNKQHRVRHGETLVVDRLPADEGKSFEPVVLLGEGKVTATVLAHGRGPKILVGKYRKRTGYKRHNGFRAATSRVEISLTPATGKAKAAAPKPAAAEAVSAAPSAPAAVEPTAAEPTVVEPELADAPALDAAADETEPEVAAAATGLPVGYAEMTVAQVSAGTKEWSHAEIAAALAYERDHAARKGALAALESALAKEDG